MFWVHNENPDAWRNKRRHTILGRWHELKQNLWSEHLLMCGHANETIVEWEEY